MNITKIVKIQSIGVLLLGLMSCGNSPAVNTKSAEPQPISSSASPASPSPSSSISPASRNTFSIADLQKAPRQSTVTLQGKVVQQVAIVNGTVYELQDSTGSVWVLSQQPVAIGEEVTLSGVLRYQSISLNGKEQGSLYIEQIQPAKG